MKKKWSGERLETNISGRDMIEHLHRYSLCSEYIYNKIVLDIACGDGYGSFLMSEKASHVYGVDIDQPTILNAQKKYIKSNLNFLIGSADKTSLKDNSIDIVVSFETIEHHDKHHEMMQEIKRVLKPDGILIISTPDKAYYSELRNFKNEFHVKELYKDEFKVLISSYFKETKLLIQEYTNGSSIIRQDTADTELQVYTGDFYKTFKETLTPLFLIAIASDANLEYSKNSIFNGCQLIENIIKKNYDKSFNYRVGKIILLPFKFLFKFFK